MRKLAFEITENMKTFAKVNRAVDTLIMKGTEMTTGMKLMQTKSGKIHLLSAGGTRAVCTVNKKTGISKRVINMESEIIPEDALKADPKNFCKKCLGQQPYVFIQQIIDENSPRPEPEPIPVEIPQPEVELPKSEYGPITANPNFMPVAPNGMDMAEVVEEMRNRLNVFADDVNYSTRHRRFKALYYAQAFEVIRDMLRANDSIMINDIMKKLV